MTTDKCFSCERKDVSPLCGICGVGLNGEREHYKRKPITNADRIRSLSDEELAEELWAWNQVCCYKWTKDKILNWLKEEAEGDT